MFYTELTFHISPYVEDIADAIIAELGDLGYDSFSYSDDGFKAYIPSKNFDEEQVKYDTFIAEFFDSNICFSDTSALVTEAMKGCSFETQTDSSNGVQNISLKGKNGGGMIDVLCIDLSQSDLDHDMEYILENFGDYYFGQTSAQMSGITEDDFVSIYRMTSSVVSKCKYQRYGSVQKSDGMATQFGYTETYAVLSEDKLTVVSGAFLSSDMMERQSFSQLMSKFAENVKY